jgi:hypothetical protein
MRGADISQNALFVTVTVECSGGYVESCGLTTRCMTMLQEWQ